MKPGFALSLSVEGITLLLRDGPSWWRVGTVGLDTPDLEGALNKLRLKAEDLSASAFACKIILPNDQIRYMTLDTGAVDNTSRRQAALAALDGATPYAVKDLAVDISGHGRQTHVAAVALETLAEAEAFAVEHNFNPIAFVAMPDDGAFLGEPFFGQTVSAADKNAVGQVYERDSEAIVVVGDAQSLIDKPVTKPTLEAAPMAGFTSRRGKGRTTATVDSDARAARATSRPQSSPPLPPRPSRPAPTVTAPSIPHPPKTAPRAAPKPQAEQAREPAKPAIEKAPPPPQVTSVDMAQGLSEAEKMVVFGERQKKPAPKRGRRVGLMLGGFVLCALIAFAAWAALGANSTLQNIVRGAFSPDAPSQPPVESAEPAQPPAEATEAIVALDRRILDMPAQRIAAPAPEPEPPTQPTAAPPAKSPLVAGVSENLAPLAAPLAGDSAPPSIARPRDAIVTPAARVNPPRANGDGKWAIQLPVIQGPAEPPSEKEDPPEPTGAMAVLSDDGSNTPDRSREIASYAVSGIWSTAPEASDTPGVIQLDDLYVAAIDHATLTQDAVALPTIQSYQTDISPAGVTSPAAAGNTFELDALGLVDPSPEGTLTPEGILVYLGNPPKVPPPTPRRFETIAAPEPLVPDLPKVRPRQRPTGLAEAQERVELGGLTREELRELRPRARPFTPTDTEALTAALETVSLSPAEQRLSQFRPKKRPSNMAALVAKAAPAPAPAPQPAPAATASTSTAAQAPSSSGSTGPAAAASVAAVDSTARNAPAVPRSQTARPSGSTPASVAKQATIENAINLHRVNLIGVYGTPSNRRALVRLSNGRYKKVKVGDVIDGGRIVAIGDSELRYQKSGRNLVLRLPKS